MSLDDARGVLNDGHDAYRIALYYCYVPLHELHIDGIVDLHANWSQKHTLGGRIRVAQEGLNGVLSGLHVDLVDYEHQLRSFITSIDTEATPTAVASLTWELDVKYCRLRPDLTLQSQLFAELQVDRTSSVVGLVDMNGYDPSVKEGGTPSSSDVPSRGYSSRRRHKKKLEHGTATEQKKRAQSVLYRSLDPSNITVPHLTPTEWDAKLLELSNQPDANVVLLDCRNAYESAIGYFTAPGASTATVLTNTRKYSELATVLMEQVDETGSLIRSASVIMTYCTGGVRCERASGFLAALLADRQLQNETSNATVPEIYQLHGGIQKYLEVSSNHGVSSSHFQGKNFVFDPRRTDPVVSPVIVGRCLVCRSPHDDYDMGHAPVANQEARCFKCRVLILVCPTCRPTVSCWGDDSDASSVQRNPRLYCSGLEPNECQHKPPVQVIRSSTL